MIQAWAIVNTDVVVRCLATTRMGTENGNDDKNGSVNVNENENDLLFV